MDFPVNTNRVNGDKPGEVSPVAPGDASGVLPLIKDLSCLSEGFDEYSIDAFAGPGNAEETMIRHCWAQPTAFTAIAAGVQTGVWSHVAKYAGPFNAADVAKELKIDSSLLFNAIYRLLINENFVPDIEAHWKATSPDMMMMMMMMMIMLVSARERTLELWKALIEKAGLKIIRVYSATSSAESLIECELAWGLLELYPH
ncbi:unnamed protein product [Clonostachys rosea f. rosea IK726]|uniref:Uncharacterized protein n=1 Tax=Clonostachys rosea f. rosea IK726 TaxID=1349383 RepID=A0ACA9UBL2_BIOOC|nr:unnamed protein product [Clonostachys rosea f. rosea IK726]